MPNEYVSVDADAWVQLNSTAVSAMRIQNASNSTVELYATSSPVVPTGGDGAIDLSPGLIVLADTAVADMFPAISSGYLWARCRSAQTRARISVSY